MPSPSPKPQRNELNSFEHVKLKPINSCPIRTEQKTNTTTTTPNIVAKDKSIIPPITTTTNTVAKDKSSIPPTKEKPRRAVAPTQDKAQDLASPVKENRSNIPKLSPVNHDADTKMDTREAAVSMPLKDTRLPAINEHKRTKSRRAKTVAQPVKAIGYMKEAPGKPAWIEIAQVMNYNNNPGSCSHLHFVAKDTTS